MVVERVKNLKNQTLCRLEEKNYLLKKKLKKKGNFLNPLVYKFSKNRIEKIMLKNKPHYNIRNSSCVKSLIESTFYIHNGKDLIKNDTQYMKEIYKKQSFKSFKLGQYSYNRRPIVRNRRSEIWIIFKDLKRKKGIDVKYKKKKKRFFTMAKNLQRGKDESKRFKKSESTLTFKKELLYGKNFKNK